MPEVKSIFIANLTEIALPLVRLMKQSRGEEEIFEDHALCDRFIFSAKDNQVLITPFPIASDFYQDSLTLLQLKNVTNLSPEKIEESLCRAILQDNKLAKTITEIVGHHPGIEIVSYAATPEFYELTEYLRNLGLKFSTPEAPSLENRWVADFFDSKAGFRQTVGNILKDFPPMPEGIICDGKEDIVGWTNYFLKKYHGCVLKTNRGLAGAGLKIVKASDNVEEIISSEAYWQEGPIIVERFVTPDLSVCGGAPNIELRIKGGKIEKLYTCSMRITAEGVFQGVELGKEAVPQKIVNILQKTGHQFGNLLNGYGYRGNFELDWVCGLDGKIFPIEANLRQTGGTHVYALGKRLLGEKFLDNFYLTARNMGRATKITDYGELKKETSDLWFNQKKKRGVIITITKLLGKHQLGYVVVGPTKKWVLEAENELDKRIN